MSLIANGPFGQIFSPSFCVLPTRCHWRFILRRIEAIKRGICIKKACSHSHKNAYQLQYFLMAKHVPHSGFGNNTALWLHSTHNEHQCVRETHYAETSRMRTNIHLANKCLKCTAQRVFVGMKELRKKNTKYLLSF